jgi:hypothetical protein
MPCSTVAQNPQPQQGVGDGESLALHREQERWFDDVEAYRLIADACLGQDALDLGDGTTHQARLGSDGPSEALEARPLVLLR